MAPSPCRHCHFIHHQDRPKGEFRCTTCRERGCAATVRQDSADCGSRSYYYHLTATGQRCGPMVPDKTQEPAKISAVAEFNYGKFSIA